jgi:transcriptional regulator with XRE-family HTH domain
MTKNNPTSVKEEKKYKFPKATETLGKRLKVKRKKLKFSISDVALFTGFSTSTIDDLEKGITVDVNYYITYAQTLYFPLPELFNIRIKYGPRFPLTAKKEARIFLTNNINTLLLDDFFSKNQSVDSVAKKLHEKKVLKEITLTIRSKISAVLSKLVKKEILIISDTIGRNHLYINNSPKKNDL